MVDEAIKEGAIAVKLDTQGNANAHNNYGMALASARRFDEAIPEFQRAIELDPSIPEAQYNIGYALSMQGKFREAIPYYQKALELNPNFARAQAQLNTALQQVEKEQQ
jgi:tetratricopeptide (TPR) repeat protein